MRYTHQALPFHSKLRMLLRFLSGIIVTLSHLCLFYEIIAICYSRDLLCNFMICFPF